MQVAEQALAGCSSAPSDSAGVRGDAALADTLKARIEAAYDFSRPGALERRLSRRAVTVGNAGIASRMTAATAEVQGWIATLRAEGVFATAAPDAGWRELADFVRRAREE